MPSPFRSAQRLEPPIHVRRLALLLGECRHDVMLGRELTYGVRGARIARERERLTTAAAEILPPPWTARARLLHPIGAAEGLKRRRVLPDILDRMLAHRPEFETRNGFCRMAWQHLAGRRHVERAPAPAADARFGKARIIIRDDRVDDDRALV